MTECQKERRRCLYQAARALRIYREFVLEANEERINFWRGIFQFWLNEYREMSVIAMNEGHREWRRKERGYRAKRTEYA